MNPKVMMVLAGCVVVMAFTVFIVNGLVREFQIPDFLSRPVWNHDSNFQ